MGKRLFGKEALRKTQLILEDISKIARKEIRPILMSSIELGKDKDTYEGFLKLQKKI